MIKIPTIQIGCLNFAEGRLEAFIRCDHLETTACVDLDIDGTRKLITSLEAEGAESYGLSERVYSTLEEAVENHPEAQACIIYTNTFTHAQLVMKSLSLGLHTLCVKPVAINQAEYIDILKTYRKQKGLLLMQGHNLRWTSSSLKLQEWLQDRDRFGELEGGDIRFRIRQQMRAGIADTKAEGMYFHCASSHQVDQLTAVLGLPCYVTARYHRSIHDEEIGHAGVWGTNGGHMFLEYPNGACITHSGTRAGHCNFEGCGWNGSFILHGSNGDIWRENEKLKLFQRGKCVEQLELPPAISPKILDEDRLQMDACGEAILAAEGQESLFESTILGTWILSEASNESARKGQRIELAGFKAELLRKAGC